MPFLLFINTQKEIHLNNVENILKPRRLLSVLVVVMSDWGEIKKMQGPFFYPLNLCLQDEVQMSIFKGC